MTGIIIFSVLGYLFLGFITYILGYLMGVLGRKTVKVEYAEDDYDYRISEWYGKPIYPSRLYKSILLPNKVRVIQFIFWPVILVYLILLILVRLAEFICDEKIIKHKEDRDTEYKKEEVNNYGNIQNPIKR